MNETDEVQIATSNPVLRTTLYAKDVYSAKRYWSCVMVLIGTAMIIVSPLASLATRNAIQRGVVKRQQITNSTNCFVQRENNITQICEHQCTMRITFYNVVNSEDVLTRNSTPAWSEIGPFEFLLNERHASVQYLSSNRVQFNQRGPLLAPMEAACGGACNWSQEITVLRENGLRTGMPEELVSDIWPDVEKEVVLNTGGGSSERVFETIKYDDLDNVFGKFNGRLFGNGFDLEEGISIFDERLRSGVHLVKTSKHKRQGIKTIAMELEIDEECLTNGQSCEKLLWNTSSNVVHSLPYLYPQNASFANFSSGFERGTHDWEVLIDEYYGFTVFKRITYQENHWIDAFGGGGCWAPMYWSSISCSANEAELSFIKHNRQKESLVFYLCDLSIPLFGAGIVCLFLGLMVCTPSARKRLQTIAILARSRARDVRLNPGQFKSLGVFLRTQMKRKGARSTSSNNQNPGGTKSTSSKPEFDDVRSIPNTNSV